MTELAFTVTDRKVTRTDTARIVGGSIDEYTAEFTLDAMWTESIITSVWVKDGEGYKAVLTAGVCSVPNEVLTGYGEVTVSLYAGDLRTTVPACIWVEASGYIEGVTPAVPTPSEYVQIVAAYDTKADKADTYTEDEVDALLASKSGTDHTHDDRYYTELEIDTIIGGLPAGDTTGCEKTENKVIELSEDSTDEQYPSAKAVFDNVSGTIGAYIEYFQQKPLVFTDVTVSTWEEDTTYTDYGYKATISLTGATATMIPHVYFSGTDALSGNYAPPPESYNGGIYLYGKTDTGVAIPLITLEATS